MTTELPRLVTTPISHYCEKARWGLERAGIDYVEERHLQGFHHWYAKRAGGGLTTPVLELPGGESIGQSSAILQWIDKRIDEPLRLYPDGLAPRARAIEHWLDITLGPDGRAWMYGHMITQIELVENYGLEGIPERESRMFRVMLKVMKPYLALRVRLQHTSTDIRTVHDVFDEIGDRLSDGRPFLLGDRFTAADLTFASLSAAVLLPRNYGIELPPVELLPPHMREQVEGFRAHPAGQFALRVIDDERPQAPWLAAEASSASAVVAS